MTKATIQILFLAFVMGFMPYSFYTLGHAVATYRVAHQCANDNSFTEHGNEFYCQDINDYRGT